tara:strand:+ start:172 stop:348 length:177 start_codon:yes stop_codon:yes gene_type:complete
MNRIKEETYSEICELYKNSIKEMSKEINGLKQKLQAVQDKNDELTYKLINTNIEIEYK